MQSIKRSFGIALWFIFLTFPFMVVRVNTLKNIVEWRWLNMLWVGIGAFILSWVWRWALERKESKSRLEVDDATEEGQTVSLTQRLFEEPKIYRPLIIAAALFFLVFPLLFNISQVNIMVLALIFVVLGLGLNINVGLAGMLDLGYVAFFAIGAYTYGILNSKFGLGFWPSLPLGGLVATIFGVILGFPILRLRGDYLAIVTLGFATIAHVVILNGDDLFGGAQGIANISRPGLFGIEMSIAAVTTYIYYLMIALVIFTIFITNRLKDSRIGRAWMALREDEIACVAMGIDMARTKLSAYAFGAFWAGLVGVIFAARNTYLHPNSFTFMESAIVLSIVVLGGMGSILGVMIAALVLVLMPEYLRAFSDYRMLAFGAVMVLMMIFRPQGLIANVRRTYTYQPAESGEEGGSVMSRLLEVKGLTMDFGGLRAVDAVSLEVCQGEIVALIGPNGAGKTTFFNCVTGIYKPTGGAILAHQPDGTTHKLNGMAPHRITSIGMARTFQNIRLFPAMTVLENVMIGRHCRTTTNILGAILRGETTRRQERETIEKSYQLLEKVGLGPYVNEFARNLPYGAQRRLEIARAMATDPFLLLLDEPAAGMNPQETHELDALIERIRGEGEMAILLIEHDMKLVMNISDRIYVMEYGKEIAQGTPQEVRNNPKVIEAYLGEEATA